MNQKYLRVDQDKLNETSIYQLNKYYIDIKKLT